MGTGLGTTRLETLLYTTCNHVQIAPHLTLGNFLSMKQESESSTATHTLQICDESYSRFAKLSHVFNRVVRLSVSDKHRQVYRLIESCADFSLLPTSTILRNIISSHKLLTCTCRL